MKGIELWNYIEQKARDQEEVDDNWSLTMVDLGRPLWTGRADYRLKNIVTHESKEGHLLNWKQLSGTRL